jgi:hypothetical protein
MERICGNQNWANVGITTTMAMTCTESGKEELFALILAGLD